MSDLGGDGVDYGITTGEQFQHFVYWTMKRHERQKFTDAEVMDVLREEYPYRTDRSKHPNNKRRKFQAISLHRGYARNLKKVGIRNEQHAAEILARIDRAMRKNPKQAPNDFQFPEELNSNETYAEGLAFQVTVNRYERDPKARELCLKAYGYRCHCCKKTMEEVYGPVGKHVIHVHHELELSSGGKRNTDPTRDLKPICPNCHAIIHAQPSKPMKVKELQQLLLDREI